MQQLDVQKYPHDEVPVNWNGLLIVDGSWGKYEEEYGKPLQGAVGNQFNKILAACKINRSDCWITSTAKTNIHELITELKPKVTILLGKEMTTSLLGFNYKNIEDWRGSILDYCGHTVIPCIHPKDILRGGGSSHWYLPAVINDIKRAKAVLCGHAAPHHPEIHIIDSPVLLETYLNDCVGIPTAFDIETTYDGGSSILSIGFSHSKDLGFVVPFLEGSQSEPAMMVAILNKYMSGDKIPWIGQNIYNFDIPVIQRVWGFKITNCYMDTMVAHQVLHPELPHDLGTINSFYSTIPFYKNTSGDDLLHYNGLDAVATKISADAMEEELGRRQLKPVYAYAHSLTFGPLQQMHIEGVKVNRYHQERVKMKWMQQIKEVRKDINKYFSGYSNTQGIKTRVRRIEALIAAKRKTVKLPNKKKGKLTSNRLTSLLKKTKERIKSSKTLNVRSPKQLVNFLYTTLKLPKRTKDGKLSTDETTLKRLYLKTQNIFLKKIILLRQLQNKYSKYGKMSVDPNGTVKTSYKFVESMRLSSGAYGNK